MEKIDLELNEIDEYIQELLLIDDSFRADWSKNKKITAQDVQKFETEISTSLPIGFRKYILKYGMGGPYLRDDLDYGIPTNLNLSDEGKALAKEPFGFKRTFVKDKNEKQKQNIKKTIRGANERNGTLSLGCPTGTHTSFYLILNSEYAGEVWKGAWSLKPNKNPSFLAMNLIFFKKQLRIARKNVKLNTQKS